MQWPGGVLQKVVPKDSLEPVSRFNKVVGCRSATLLLRDYSIGVFL